MHGLFELPAPNAPMQAHELRAPITFQNLSDVLVIANPRSTLRWESTMPRSRAVAIRQHPHAQSAIKMASILISFFSPRRTRVRASDTKRAYLSPYLGRGTTKHPKPNTQLSVNPVAVWHNPSGVEPLPRDCHSRCQRSMPSERENLHTSARRQTLYHNVGFVVMLASKTFSRNH